LTLDLPLQDWNATEPLDAALASTTQTAIAIRVEIEILETQLGRIIGGESRVAAAPRIKRKKRMMSAAARAKISAAAKARWAKFRAKKGKE